MAWRPQRRRGGAARAPIVGGPIEPRRTFRFVDLERGWLVSDSEDVRLGTIAEVGEATLVVARGLLQARLYVPASAVGDVHEGRVRLNVSGPWIVAQGWDRPGGRPQR